MSTRSTLQMLSVLVMFLLLIAPRSAAQEDPATPITPPPSLSTLETLAVWNSSRYPATDFRSEATPPMFALWPENLSYVKFLHYCEDATNHTRRLKDFVYKEGQGKLVTRPYFDVGQVDDFKPYFQHWQFWQVDIKRLTVAVDCEYIDLQRLYYYRLKRNVLETGLGYGVAAVVILQGAVIAFTALLWVYTQSTRQEIPRASTQATFWSTIRHSLRTLKSETPWIDCFCDWTHLLLLVVIGFAMMEGVGHSFRWRSALLFNAAVTYTYLTIFSMSSSFLHQCAHFLTQRSSCTDRDSDLPILYTPPARDPDFPILYTPPARDPDFPILYTPPARDPDFPILYTPPARDPDLPILYTPPARDPVLLIYTPPARSRDPDLLIYTPPAAGAKSGISEDWRYQRIFGQCGVMVLMGTYLVYVDDEEGQVMDSVGGIVLAAIVVACIWSAGVSAVVILRSTLVILQCLFPKYFYPRTRSRIHPQTQPPQTPPPQTPPQTPPPQSPPPQTPPPQTPPPQSPPPQTPPPQTPPPQSPPPQPTFQLAVFEPASQREALTSEF